MISKIFFRIFIAPIIKYRYTTYLEDLKNVEQCQKDLLHAILQKVSSTHYGIEQQINNEFSLKEFQEKIPLNNYQKLSPYLENEYQNIKNQILNPGALIWEKTSGSSQKKKLIPYNQYSLRDFRDMIVYWVGDLAQSTLNIKIRKIFFSISMHLDSNSGIESDTDYLPWYFKLFFKKYLLLPEGLKSIKDPHLFNVWLCAHLLLDKSINILFIWSPTYFISLIEFITEHQSEILQVIQKKNLSYNDETFYLKVKNQRPLEEIEQMIKTQKWNDIDIISCWVDGSSRYFLEQLRAHFPQAKIQGKGLLATEAPLTFPSEQADGYLPLVKNIFYEFINSNGEMKLLHELKTNEQYELVITNRSGLIRYKMNDIIEVTKLYEKTPCFKFISRTGMSVDLTGEKMDLLSVERIFEKLAINDDSFLCPIIDNPSYYLFVTKSHENLSEAIEQELNTHYHYEQSRKLNQLNPITPLIHDNPKQLYNDLLIGQGIKLGDIKFNRIITKPLQRDILDNIN